jgi:serine/threonine protein kinase
VQRKPEWWVKLGDFGLAKKQTDGTIYHTKAGTEKYMAPELYYYVPGLNTATSEYTNAVDIWALGCIIYMKNYAGGRTKLLFEVSPPMNEAEAFVHELLIPYPAKRPTASAALEHYWCIASECHFNLAASRNMIS